VESEVEGNGSEACGDQSLALEGPVCCLAGESVNEQHRRTGPEVIVNQLCAIRGSKGPCLTSHCCLLGQSVEIIGVLLE
jgi:hypothetical protein